MNRHLVIACTWLMLLFIVSLTWFTPDELYWLVAGFKFDDQPPHGLPLVMWGAGAFARFLAVIVSLTVCIVGAGISFEKAFKRAPKQ